MGWQWRSWAGVGVGLPGLKWGCGLGCGWARGRSGGVFCGWLVGWLVRPVSVLMRLVEANVNTFTAAMNTVMGRRGSGARQGAFSGGREARQLPARARSIMVRQWRTR